MKKWVIKSGIQRKYLRYIMGLLLLAIFAVKHRCLDLCKAESDHRGYKINMNF